MNGLVLTAGGARGAYQAGVLKRLGELPAFAGRPSPFPIVVGASAGAINGTMIAAGSGDFGAASRRLADLWANLRVHDVFRTDLLALGMGAARWVRDLSLGGLIGGGVATALLDASPLDALLSNSLRLDGIGDAIHDGHLFAVAIAATSYHSGRSFIFVQGRPGHPVWMKSRRVVRAVELTVDHVRASAAIPIVFPPVAIRSSGTEVYFGDGGLRQVTPLSPAIRLGAERLFAIGVRSPSAAARLSQAELGALPLDQTRRIPPPPLAQICGVFLNAIFLDHLDTDLDHLRRMNELIQSYQGRADLRPSDAAPKDPLHEPMRIVTPFSIGPSEDLALVAERCAHRMPRILRHVLDGLGTPDAQSADLMSYLLFDGAYTRTLIDIGYRDADAAIDELEHFVRTEAATVAA
ncbi:MAG: patatin-like phospholipase family protein [Candidatus Binatia bacterium]